MKQEIKERIISFVDNNTTATMFGFVRLNRVRFEADVPEEISDDELKDFLVEQYKNDFINGLAVKTK